MGRRRGILGTLIQIERASRRDQINRHRQQVAYARNMARATREAERGQRAQQRYLAAEAREQTRLYVESRTAEADEQDTEVKQRIAALQSILQSGLARNSYVDLDTLKHSPKDEPFQPGALAHPLPLPDWQTYLPAPLGWIANLVPGAKAKHEQRGIESKRLFEAELSMQQENERRRQQGLEDLRAQHEANVAQEFRRVQTQHTEVEKLKAALQARSPDAVVEYFDLVLGRSEYPDDFPGVARLAYVPESKQLVVEMDLPKFEIVPEVESFRYVKSKDEIVESSRPVKERRALYLSVIAQTTLRTLHEVFSADRAGMVETIVLNGHVDEIDRSTGQPVRPCVVTVRTSRDVFATIDLQYVDPNACLRALHASVSKSPEELAPVRPVLEFNMVDPRFIEEVDVLSTLDQRPNLMELTPGEFENLITNLFIAMGLEARLTRSSRDGGVDCIAYDPRPIFGGKVVIQAKRYKHTVGVSAVRDLFGTLQNEGASKGILVTTSGYGKASYDFAEGKPIELLSGSHLLHLLAEHAGMEARIVVPEDWKDPSPDFDLPEGPGT
jgi:restriction system protein